MNDSPMSTQSTTVLNHLKEPEPEPNYETYLPPSKIREQVPSSGYGKVTAQLPPKPEPPQYPFKPELPPHPLRAAVPSSAYGKVTPVRRPSNVLMIEMNLLLQVRPKTAPSKSNDFVLDGVAVTTQNRYKPTADRYVLLKDKGDVDEDELKRQRSVSPIRASTKLGAKLRKSVPSSAYGKVIPSKPGMNVSFLHMP